MWSGNRARAAEDRRTQRRACAEELYDALEALQLAVQSVSRDADPVHLAGTVSRVYGACRRAERLQPRACRHLYRSIRSSVGAALGGVAWCNRRTICEHEVVSYDYEWAQVTADYLELARDQVGAWRIAYTERQSDRVRLPDFDTWLVDTGRWEPSYGPPMNSRGAIAVPVLVLALVVAGCAASGQFGLIALAHLFEQVRVGVHAQSQDDIDSALVEFRDLVGELPRRITREA